MGIFTRMTLSLEVRWFLPGPIPELAGRWFDALGPPVQEVSRTDRYLVPTESEDMGLKVREGRIEAKQRTETGARRAWGAVEARPEAWRKWTLGLATDARLAPGWVDVPKTRRQRWVALQPAACALELAEVTLDGAVWWTICVEASGGDVVDRQRVFLEAAGRWLDRSDAPVLPFEAALGYPAWLRGEVG
jgi:hypothetical protein